MKWLLITLCMLVLPINAYAVTKEVIQGGGGDYTTIQACWNAIAAGDTCNVHAGTYTEQLTVKSGTAGNLKTIQRNGSDHVIVTSTLKPVVFSANNDYWKLDGLDIRYTGTQSAPSVILDTYDGSRGAVNGWTITNCTLTLGGTPTLEGFVVYIADASNATFTNNTLFVTATTGSHDGMEFLNAQTLLIDNNALQGIASTAGTMQDGIVVDGTDITITNNTFNDGWDKSHIHPDGIVVQGPNCCGITNRVLIQGNTVKNFTQGIYIDCFSGDCLNIDVFNNVVREEVGYTYNGITPAMNCISPDSENVGQITLRVYNNVLDCRQLSFYTSRPKAINTIDMKNNLIYLNGSAPIYVAAGSTIDYNYYVSAICNDGFQINYQGNWYSFPSFVAGTPHEDHGLCSTSAALSMPTTYIPDADANTIGRGADLSAVFTTDKAGTARSVPWDIGAYEFGGAAVPTPKFFKRRFQQ